MDFLSRINECSALQKSIIVTPSPHSSVCAYVNLPSMSRAVAHHQGHQPLEAAEINDPILMGMVICSRWMVHEKTAQSPAGISV
jgi:hypothetical protein